MKSQAYRTLNDRPRLGESDPAFTVVEVILVLAILGIVASIAVPRYADFLAHRHVEAAVRRIAVDLSLAQHRARSSSSAITVTFDTAASSYAVSGITDPDHPTNSYVVSLSKEPYIATIVSADLGGDAAVVFNGYGVPDGGGTIVVQVGTYQETITLDADTGRVVPEIREATPQTE